MKVLIVNGSPKGPKSNTMQMTNAVLKGLKETNPEAEIELLTVKDMDIKPCMGCMSCWGKTAGQCVINDVCLLYTSCVISVCYIHQKLKFVIKSHKLSLCKCVNARNNKRCKCACHFIKSNTVRIGYPFIIRGNHSASDKARNQRILFRRNIHLNIPAYQLFEKSFLQ